jgi:phosphatidylserine synthase
MDMPYENAGVGTLESRLPLPKVDRDPGQFLVFLKDFANLLTLAGLFCALLGIFFAVQGNVSAAIIAMLWALWFDWSDGPVARRTPGRTEQLRAFGGQLDSLVDVVSFGVCPAVLFLSCGGFSVWFIPGAFLLLAACVVRLSYFNVYHRPEDTSFPGLSADHNTAVIAIVCLLDGVVEHAVFVSLLYVAVVVLAVLNVSPFQMSRRSSVGWYYGTTCLVVGLTGIYAWRLLAA